MVGQGKLNLSYIMNRRPNQGLEMKLSRAIDRSTACDYE